MSRFQKSKYVKKDMRKLRPSSSSSSSQAARLSKYRHVSKIRDDEARAELDDALSALRTQQQPKSSSTGILASIKRTRAPRAQLSETLDEFQQLST